MKKILVIDDSPFFRGQLRVVLSSEYAVAEANDGEEGLELVKREKPDLVLLDGVLRGMSGFEVCRILRESESNNLMPIVMITSSDKQEDILLGLELGADDYITKPFNNRELISRIKNLLRRIDRNRNANPLTGLPGNIEIQREVVSRISRGDKFAVGYVDLDNFKAYNDAYSFSRGDTVIVLTADILRDQIRLWGNADDFTGHIGGDDFIFVTTPDKVERICEEIIAIFDEKIRGFYNEADRAAHSVRTINRKGEVDVFPLMSISIAVATNRHRELDNYLIIGDIAAELKKKLKRMQGSNYCVDRRADASPASDGERRVL
ncbi:MAG: response regulator [Clostridiales Family XIII bacterium]|nr:response regulator [Clostridiales Family XIII bacterium]